MLSISTFGINVFCDPLNFPNFNMGHKDCGLGKGKFTTTSNFMQNIGIRTNKVEKKHGVDNC
jgi:hypothetical protein